MAKNYIGVKRVKAEPMTRENYCSFRGWGVPTDENPEDEGFIIFYPDGFISWLPKKQFNDAYRECIGNTLPETADKMQSSDYKDRFFAEFKQLDIRIDSLGSMLDKYRKNELDFKPSCSYELLMSQLNVMYAYKCILEERARIENIDLFK